MIGLATIASFTLHVAAGSAPERFGFLVHPPALAEVAREWDAYRRDDGWIVHRIEVAADATPEFLREELARRVRAAAPTEDAQVAILLLGDDACTPELRVPTFRIPQRDPDLLGHQLQETNPTFATDHPFTTIARDTPCRLTLGRVPVSSAEEARAILAKVRDYESTPPSAASDRLEFVAGEARFGIFDPIFEQLFVAFIDECVPPRFDVAMTYAKPTSPWCPSPSATEATTLDRLARGSLAFTYAGHGFARGLDRLEWRDAEAKKRFAPILRAESAEKAWPETPLRPVAILSCCSAGWFDQADGRDSLAEALLANPNGPIAVIAGTRVTHPYANALVVKEYLSTLLRSSGETLGEIDRRARRAMLDTDERDRRLERLVEPIARVTRWRTSLPDLRSMHVDMYVLFGDPMTRLATPSRELQSMSITDGTLTARMPDIAGVLTSGNAEITIETELGEPAAHAQLQPAHPGDDLEARTQHNYPLANARVLWRTTAKLNDGEIRVDLPTPLPARAALVRVRVVARDADGGSAHAVGARRLVPTGAGRRLDLKR